MDNIRQMRIIRNLILTTIVTIILSLVPLLLLAKKEQAAELAHQKEVYSKILDSATAPAEEISVDYGNKIHDGSPLLFGGTHSPLVAHDDAWQEIKNAGVTMIRTDFGTNQMIRKTTLEDYRSNKNNIQDIENWNQQYMNDVQAKFAKAKANGMTTMGIVDYAPAWLTYSGTDFGVPKDWVIYKNLVKKTYAFYRKNVDYVEIWNEPSFDYFLNVSGSNMSKEEAYKMIFKTAVAAIREVDEEANDGKRIKIGGPATHTPKEISLLEVIAQDETLRRELDFISFHNYEHVPEPSDLYFQTILAKYNLTNLPIFITEWNYNPEWSHPNPYNTGDVAISYTADKFIKFLKMGLAGANYFTLEPVDEKRPNKGEGYYAFYRWNNGKADLLPQSKTWRLFSKSVGLGSGKSNIVQTNHGDELNSIGFINSFGDKGIVVSNSTKTSHLVDFKLQDTGIEKRAKIIIFKAGKDNDALNPVVELTSLMTDNVVNFRYNVEENSVLGILVMEEKRWYDVFDSVLQ